MPDVAMPMPSERRGPPRERRLTRVSWRAAFAEFVAVATFVSICSGTAAVLLSTKTVGFDGVVQAHKPGDFHVVVALTFGLCITVLCAALQGIEHAGHINPAVTLGLWLRRPGAETALQTAVNMAAQMLGGIAGAALLLGITWDVDVLGANAVAPEYSTAQAFLAESLLTGLLVFAVIAHDSKLGPFVAGFAVFVAHAFLVPIDGCGINPARSFGPAVLSAFAGRGQFVFYTAPFVGSVAAVALHRLVLVLPAA